MAAADDKTEPTAPPRTAALIGRRMLALNYDLWPMVAVWMLISLLFNLGYYFAGHDAREIVATFSPLGILLWLCCWATTGLYAVYSWSRGGQTLGMRPWRIKVVGADGGPPTRKALWIRYAVGTASLLLGGLGFWWAWLDKQKLTWHDRVSGTRTVFVPKR